MRVSARFNERGLELVLHADSEPEKKMIGAVLNQPFEDTHYIHAPEIDHQLVRVAIEYDGHWSNKTVSSLTLKVHRQEQPAAPDATEGRG